MNDWPEGTQDQDIYMNTVDGFLDDLGVPKNKEMAGMLESLVLKDNAELMIDITWAVRQARKNFMEIQEVNAQFVKYRTDTRSQLRDLEEAKESLRYDREDIQDLRAENNALRQQNQKLMAEVTTLKFSTPENKQKLKEIVDRHYPNNKIPAIKEVREQFGTGLMEAKDLVDAEWLVLRSPEPITDNPFLKEN